MHVPEKDAVVTVESSRSGTYRRRAMLVGIAALVTTTALARTDAQVQAANGAPLVIGGDGSGSGAAQSGTAITWLTTSAGTTGFTGPGFRVTNLFTAAPDANGDGVQGLTIGAGNAGVFGRDNDFNGVGAWGAAPIGTGTFGESISGSGVAGTSAGGAGVYGQSDTAFGVRGIMTGGAGYGGQFEAGQAQLYLLPAGSATAPTTGAHQAGELFVASTGSLYYCVASGTPGTWLEVAGPASTGNLHFLSSPDRYVDTRIGLGGVQGPLPANTTKTFQLTGHGGQNGVSIPSGARAVFGNLTALGQPNALPGSFLTVWASGSQPPTSNINYGPSQVIANTFSSALDPNGNLNIFNRTDAHYLVDVSGYYL